MKFLASTVALVACVAAAPIIDLSGKGPGDDMVSKIIDVSAAAQPGSDWLTRRFISTAGTGPTIGKVSKIVDAAGAGPGDDWLTKRQSMPNLKILKLNG
jgi:hypothetical protein